MAIGYVALYVSTYTFPVVTWSNQLECLRLARVCSFKCGMNSLNELSPKILVLWDYQPVLVQ